VLSTVKNVPRWSAGFSLLRRLSDRVLRVEMPSSTTRPCTAISVREAFRRSFWLRQNEHLSMQANPDYS
jgi:hypothetical protein